ncbi:MAG: carbohydrate kinase [Microbacterium sp.]|uniref:carbohydrate kinase family protein n=1 Tax=Microbacterium sp. TaxID=51671 RepID=UPI0039E53959
MSNTARVLVIGEALMDIVVRPGAADVEHVGGSPANVALGLARLGVPVRLRTALADDERGAVIVRHLEASGVRVDPESFSLERTPTARAVIGDDGSARYEFDLEWRLPADIGIDGAEIVHVGSIASFIAPGADDLVAFLHRARGSARITFDPNIRPALVGGREAGVARTEEIAALAEVVKMSDEDAEWLYPGEPLEAVLERMLALGPRVAAITAGSDGALLASADARARVETPRVRVQDTVGAGDTFMAGLIDRMLAGLAVDEPALREFGRFAAAAASVTVSRAGADLPSRAEVEAALR